MNETTPGTPATPLYKRNLLAEHTVKIYRPSFPVKRSGKRLVRDKRHARNADGIVIFGKKKYRVQNDGSLRRIDG